MPSRVEGSKLKSARMPPAKLALICLFRGFSPLRKTLVSGTHAGESSAPIRQCTGRENMAGIVSDEAAADRQPDSSKKKRKKLFRIFDSDFILDGIK